MSLSTQGSPDPEIDGEAEPLVVGVGDALSVGNGEGLLVAAVGAEEPPGEISHHNSASTTSTPRITMIRLRQ